MYASADVALYDLVHNLLQESRAYRVGERRDDPRREYPCVQLVAPCDGMQLPAQEEFEHVECRDISPRGLSFVTGEPPQLARFVVALGTVPFNFFVADVMWVQAENAGNAWRYLVGCRFVKRLETSDARSQSSAR